MAKARRESKRSASATARKVRAKGAAKAKPANGKARKTQPKATSATKRRAARSSEPAAKPKAKVARKPRGNATGAKATSAAPKPPVVEVGARPRRRRTTASLLRAAEETTDPIERATLLETQLDQVTEPGNLMRAWFEASLTPAGRREITAEKAIAMARARATNANFLDAVGVELARRGFNNEAIEVFRMAIAAGSTTPTTEMLLGYLLLGQENPEGVELLERSLERAPDWGLPRETLAKWYVKREPARVLTLLHTPQGGEEHELRAMAFELLGQHDEMRREEELALAAFTDEGEARWRLAELHTEERNFARAYVHAHRLFERIERGEADATNDELVGVVVRAYREAGQLPGLLGWLRAQETLSPTVAWHVHFGLGALHPNPDPEVAIRAAHRMAEVMTERGDSSDARVWQVRAAGVAAKHGNAELLEELVAGGLADDANAWLEVGNCYMASDDYDAAGAAADRALLLDPHSGGALVMMCRLAMTMGDDDMLHRVAMAILVNKPAWHEGPEFLARSFARRLDITAALMHSARTIEMAAYCHNAWTARAEALVIAGDLASAQTCVHKSLAIHAGEPGDEVLMLAAALAGDRETLEAELMHRYRHLPALPFTAYFDQLRAIAGG